MTKYPILLFRWKWAVMTVYSPAKKQVSAVSHLKGALQPRPAVPAPGHSLLGSLPSLHLLSGQAFNRVVRGKERRVVL